MASAVDLIAKIKQATEALRKKELHLEENERGALLAASQELSAAVEKPINVVHKLVFAPHGAAAARIATEMGIFDAVEPGLPITAKELANRLTGDIVLIERVSRVLVTLHIFEQPEAGLFIPTDSVVAFRRDAPWNQTLIHFSEVHNPILARLPLYLAEHGFESPRDAFNGPFQEVMGTKQHYFEWLKQNPRQHKALNTLVKAQRQGLGGDWYDFFPAAERIDVSIARSPSTAVLVDVGGGSGADAAAFLRRFPAAAGKIVLQDLSEVLTGSPDIVEGINAMSHDFFTQQPIRGAAMYYLRTVLHDWPDAEAKKILEAIRPAMTEHSSLLVNEFIMPEKNPPFVPSSLDLSMMALFSSLERTLEQWTSLLEDSGYVVVKVWAAKYGPIRIIEAKVR